MKILHILNDGPTTLSKSIIDAQSKEHEIKIIDLTKKDVTYDGVVDAIFANDRVISW